MNILTIAIIIFLFLETINVLMLYFTPGTRRGNGLGVFNAYEKSKENPELHVLVKYLVNWVAGTKIIFITLLIVILIFGDYSIKLYAVIALIFSIITFYWRLYPIIRNMDKAGQITPKGYSRTLAFMIAGFIAIFVMALVITIVK